MPRTLNTNGSRGKGLPNRNGVRVSMRTHSVLRGFLLAPFGCQICTTHWKGRLSTSSQIPSLPPQGPRVAEFPDNPFLQHNASRQVATVHPINSPIDDFFGA